jgi:hypothetical protein
LFLRHPFERKSPDFDSSAGSGSGSGSASCIASLEAEPSIPFECSGSVWKAPSRSLISRQFCCPTIPESSGKAHILGSGQISKISDVIMASVPVNMINFFAVWTWTNKN